MQNKIVKWEEGTKKKKKRNQTKQKIKWQTKIQQYR